MVVWGGSDAVNVYGNNNTGGRYDPATDTWMSTSTTGVPEGRKEHIAVWTGSVMVVWGGVRGGSRLGSGGRYVLGASVDDDADGFTECSGDCNDENSSIYPGANELCDGLDNDCNTLADEDEDGDGYGACTDCSPHDPTAHAVPSEVTGVVFSSDKSTLSWNSAAPGAGSGTVHDVPKGDLAELPVGAGPSEVCLASGIAASTTTDPSTPAPESGFWYLVRGRNVCGAGTYGAQSDGTERITTVCP